MTITITIVSAILLFLIRSVKGGETCDIFSDNHGASYICSGVFDEAGEATVDTSNLGCQQLDFEKGDEGTHTLSTNTQMCGSSEVIDCILFAVFGKVGGTCAGVVHESNTECDFFDEIGEVIYLPDNIGNQCLGKSKCDIRVHHDGSKYYWHYYDESGQLDESLTSEIDVSSLPERLTFKFLYRCATESDQGGSEYSGGDGTSSDVHKSYIIKVGHAYDLKNSEHDYSWMESVACKNGAFVRVKPHCVDFDGMPQDTNDISSTQGEREWNYEMTFSECEYTGWEFEIYCINDKNTETRIGHTKVFEASQVNDCNEEYAEDMHLEITSWRGMFENGRLFVEIYESDCS